MGIKAVDNFANAIVQETHALDVRTSAHWAEHHGDILLTVSLPRDAPGLQEPKAMVLIHTDGISNLTVARRAHAVKKWAALVMERLYLVSELMRPIIMKRDSSPLSLSESTIVKMAAASNQRLILADSVKPPVIEHAPKFRKPENETKVRLSATDVAAGLASIRNRATKRAKAT